MFEFETQGAVELITPQVAINHENVEQLFSAVAEKPFAGQPMVVLDLCNVPLIDSAGLETLVDLQLHLRESAGMLKLAGLTSLCHDIFRITGLVERFEIYEDTNTAVRSFLR